MCEDRRWSCGLMDKALVFGTKDCRLESCQDQKKVETRWACLVGCRHVLLAS